MKKQGMHAWVQKGKEMVCAACMHYICFLICFVCLATRPAAFNLLVSNAHYQQFTGMGKKVREICVCEENTERFRVGVYIFHVPGLF